MKVSTIRDMITDTQYMIVIHNTNYSLCETIKFDYLDSIDKHCENLKKVDAHPNAKVHSISYNNAQGMIEIYCLEK